MYLPHASPRRIVEAVKAAKLGEDEVALILIAEQDRPDIQKLISAMNADRLPFFGGIFPGVISGAELHQKGAVIKGIPVVAPPRLIRNLNSEDISFPELPTQPPVSTKEKHTAIVLVDGASAHISPFLSRVFNRLGNSVHYLGGGAGFSNLAPKPSVFASEGFFDGAAIMAFSTRATVIGVRHGWERAMGPIVATKTHGRVVKELNWRNAYEVYAETLESALGKQVVKDNLFDVAKQHPFGIIKEGVEDVIRVVLSANDEGELICGGDVPENAVLWITTGDKASLLRGAELAVEDSRKELASPIVQGVVVDCISRALLLGEKFDEELKIIASRITDTNGGASVEGVLTLGEIGSHGEESLELFNMTVVIGAMHE